MRWVRKLLLIATMVSSTGVSAELSRRWERWEPNWEFLGTMAQFRGGASGALWYPVLQDNSTICFTQAGVGWVRNAYFINFGTGVRRFITGDVIAGVNGFIDISSSDHDISYYQGGLGVELLGPCWEIHANSYFPQLKMTVIRDKRIAGATLVPDPGGGMDILTNDVRRQSLECSYLGYDAEAGYMFDVGPGELWGWAGYYYARTREGLSFQGPRFLVEYVSKPMVGWGGQVFAGVGWEHDRFHGGQTGARVGFRVPFCWHSRTRIWNKPSLCRRAAYAVRRQPGVRIERESRDRPLPRTFIANAFFAQQGGAGTGTQMDPTNVAAALAQMAPNDLLFLLQTNGNITLPAGGIDLDMSNLTGATVAGFGADGFTTTLQIQGRPLTVTALLGQQGRPIVTGGIASAVSLDSNNVIQGIGVDGSAGAILGVTATNATITDLVATNLTGAGVALGNMRGLVTLSNSSFTNLQGSGVDITATEASSAVIIKVENTSFTNVQTGLTAQIAGSGASTDILFSNNVLNTTTMGGINVVTTSVATGTTQVNLIIDNNTISGTTGLPISLPTTFVNPTDVYNVQISNNKIVSPAGAITAVNITHEGNGRVNATVTGNKESGNATATTAFNVERTGAAAPGVMCLDFTGNRTARATGITLDALPARLEVEQFPQLSALNSNMSVAVANIVPMDVPVGTCPEPVIP